MKNPPVIESKIFTAEQREIDGLVSENDLLLQMLVHVALEFPEPSAVNSVRMEIEWTGSKNLPVIFNALLNKHLRVKGRGKLIRTGPPDRGAARELILDILANKPDWKPYAGIFAAFAARNDRDFFQRIGRSVERKRKPLFDEIEWFLLLNWNEWHTGCVNMLKFPPLRFWTDDASLGLLAFQFEDPREDFKLDLPGLRAKRARLCLEQARPPQVKGISGKSDRFIVETVD